ncbi:MAG: TPM domain-containing protein [Novosphingobium sp.]
MANQPALTPDDRARVAEAVRAAESGSAGEIVTIITDQSDTYHDVALVWSAIAALLALGVVATFTEFYLGMWDGIFGRWGEDWSPRQVLELALLIAGLKFAGTWLILLWQPLRLWLTPRSIRNTRVRARAVTCFKVGAERRTHGRTGILIYLSMAEHRAEIVADEAIAAKVSPEVWGHAMASMIALIRQGSMADGMIAAVSEVGQVLAQHFPRDANDVNELPDRLIEV